MIDTTVSKTQKKFLEDEKSFNGKFSHDVFQTIALSFAAYKYRVYFLMLIGIFGRFLLLYSANVMGYWADSLCKAPATCKPVPHFFEGFQSHDFVTTLVGFACVGFVLNTFFRVAISRTGSRSVSTLYDEVTLRTSRLPMSFFDTTPVGRIVTRFSSDYAAIFRMAGGPLGEFFCLLFDLAMMIVLTMIASLWFLPVIVAVVILNWVVYHQTNVKLRKERRASARLRGPTIAHFAETVQGSTAIKVFGKRKTFVTRYDELMKDLLTQKMRTAIAVHLFSFKMSGITVGLLAVTGIWGIWMSHHHLVSVGSLGVAFTFIMMTSTTIQQFFEWLANLEEALTGIERMDDYLRRPLELGARLPVHAQFNLGEPRELLSPSEKPLAHSKATPQARIVVEKFNLRYRADLPMVLKNLSFTVEPGEHFGIIGRTGSGKSSLIQALFCLYPPESGRITIGGISPELSAVNKTYEELANQQMTPIDEYRSRMALIPQEPNLFRGTLRGNLTNDPTLSDLKLWEALERIGIAQWVRTLKHPGKESLEYPLDEGGKNLSLGERQLICMARALLRDAPIMIMDEATSSVDPASEELLVRATKEHMQGKTRIVVAHRLSTIEEADRILWLDQGEIKMLDRPSVVLPAFRKSE